ncbi:hypothetical protein NB693_20335 [Pantoea ananatis]|uniref:hypothetical protein n=1 Tax=Pantoea ananas TaxID=553 RepID=UPI0022205E37|nr:hypothetical protein [Pantoea ananatis]
MGIRKSGFLGSWIAVAASGRAVSLLRIPNPESPIPAQNNTPCGDAGGRAQSGWLPARQTANPRDPGGRRGAGPAPPSPQSPRHPLESADVIATLQNTWDRLTGIPHIGAYLTAYLLYILWLSGWIVLQKRAGDADWVLRQRLRRGRPPDADCTELAKIAQATTGLAPSCAQARSSSSGPGSTCAPTARSW